MNDDSATNDDSTSLEFSAADDAAPSGPAVPNSDPAKPATLGQAIKQHPRRQAAFAAAKRIWAERKSRTAPQKELAAGTLSREDSRRSVKQTDLDNQDRLRKARLESLHLQAFRDDLQEENAKRVAQLNSNIKNARNIVPALMEQRKSASVGRYKANRDARAKQYAQKKADLAAAHKHEQMGLSWSDPGKKVGNFFTYVGKRIAAWAGFKTANGMARIGHGVNMAGFGIAKSLPGRVIVRSGFKSQMRRERRNENKLFKSQDNHVEDLQKLAVDVAKRKNKIALARARHEHKATLAAHNKAEQPLKRHRAQQAQDLGLALGHGAKAIGHSVSAAVGHAVSKLKSDSNEKKTRNNPTMNI